MLPIFLDVSRLLSRAGASVPTGIDRVEIEYATFLLDAYPQQTHFVAYHPIAGLSHLPFQRTASFVQDLANIWQHGASQAASMIWRARRLLHRAPLERRPSPAGGVYLLLSHHHLIQTGAIERFITRSGLRFVPMVHDLIPIEFPEYARPREPARHARRIRTVARLADGIIVPSAYVRDGLRPFMTEQGDDRPIEIIPHGLHIHVAAQPAAATASRDDPPYFVCLGTIEPRKNHLLLLNIWRRLAETHGTRAPKLILIGKRGWENENIIDMLERCPALQNLVEEHGSASDRDVATYLSRARALLLPSFTEGYGLPLVEALALGVPCICSDVPVFREVAGDSATYIDPIDGPGWQAEIERRSFERPALGSSPPPPERISRKWHDQAARGVAFALDIAAGQSDHHARVALSPTRFPPLVRVADPV